MFNSFRRRIALLLCPEIDRSLPAAPAMDPNHLLRLARLYGAHVKSPPLSLNRVGVRAGTHTRLFERIEAGRGCHSETFGRVLAWFDANWPADLAWPRDIPRPSAMLRRAG
jgi:hypothetical protein